MKFDFAPRARPGRKILICLSYGSTENSFLFQIRFSNFILGASVNLTKLTQHHCKKGGCEMATLGAKSNFKFSLHTCKSYYFMLKILISRTYGSTGHSFPFHIRFSNFVLGASFNLQDPFERFFSKNMYVRRHTQKFDSHRKNFDVRFKLKYINQF